MCTVHNKARLQRTVAPSTISQLSSSTPRTTTSHIIINQHSHSLAWAVPLTIFISILLVLSACMIYIKRKRGHHLVFRRSKRPSLNKDGFSPLSTPTETDLEHMLSPNILSAPLQTVLDNLDVLDELVILLDPESHGVKNTKHLASQCSFSSPWIKYTYSMRHSKSPLKAVLEGVTSRNPDWTVRHLATLLKLIERNDAVAVLAKLSENSIVV
uniref:IGF-like family receptor 1 n=1 Tax=Anabas testudineus TaxID=64144 RepID=A0AAQ6IQ94_ANATE